MGFVQHVEELGIKTFLFLVVKNTPFVVDRFGKFDPQIRIFPLTVIENHEASQLTGHLCARSYFCCTLDGL